MLDDKELYDAYLEYIEKLKYDKERINEEYEQIIKSIDKIIENREASNTKGVIMKVVYRVLTAFNIIIISWYIIFNYFF